MTPWPECNIIQKESCLAVRKEQMKPHSSALLHMEKMNCEVRISFAPVSPYFRAIVCQVASKNSVT